MARKQKLEVTCDRCSRVYEAAESTDGAEAQSRGLFIDATELGLNQVLYEDLCPKCRKRVSDLVGLIKKGKGDESEAPAAADGDQQATHRPDPRDGSNPEAEERQ